MNNTTTKNSMTTKYVIILMMLAYLFSVAIRMIWVYQFGGHEQFMWNGQLMINTNDGYYWASAAQKSLEGLHADNPRVIDMLGNATIFLTVLFTKFTPFSLESVMLYMPTFVSSLVVIPIVLLGRLYGEVFWGFMAALLGSIVWSYYNRTMTGYYDTDMFSAMAPMFILYFLMRSTMKHELRLTLYASIAIILYPFLYDQGQIIVDAMAMIYGAYMVFYYRSSAATYRSLILVFLSLVPFGGILGIEAPYHYLVNLIVVGIAYWYLPRVESPKQLMIAAAIAGAVFLIAGDVLGLAWRKMSSYLITGTQEHGLRFYAVNQTVKEASKVLFFPLPDTMPYKPNIAHRLMGSSLGLIVAFAGYLVLVVRKKEFILALPLIGIAVFAHWGGLRFTVYAVPVAAMSAIYLFVVLGSFIKEKTMRYALVILATAGLLYPNIMHIINYKSTTVLNRAEVTDLQALDKVASSKDYTLTWWDYGYPVWFYSDTSTLIDGGKHDNDNFIISKILQTDSPELAANLSRLAVETYVDSNYSVVGNVLFRNGQPDQKDPGLVLEQLASDAYPVPKKTRDIYLYLPYRMMNIFSTVITFGNLNLVTGNAEHSSVFFPGSIAKSQGSVVQLDNGIVLDLKKGIAHIGANQAPLRELVTATYIKTGKIVTQKQPMHFDGTLVAVYLKSYGRMVVMDTRAFDSMYVQMFMLGRYDKKLFEPVVTSPYSRIYKLKR